MRHWNKELRMNRLFDACGKTVMVAMDHGQGGVKPGLSHPEKLLQTIISANPDAVLLSGGMARTFNYLFGGKHKPALVISSDFILTSSIPQVEGNGEEILQSISVQECVKLGADAIKALLVFGKDNVGIVAKNMQYIARLAEECNTWNMPLIVEPTTWGRNFTGELRKDVSLYADMARISAELGADMVKIEFVDNAAGFQQVVDGCPVPIAILGGSKTSLEQIADIICEAAACGTCGVVFGRNVWQSKNPATMVLALKALTYEGDREKFMALGKQELDT